MTSGTAAPITKIDIRTRVTLGQLRIRWGTSQEQNESAVKDLSRAIQLDTDVGAGDAFYFLAEARRALGLLDKAASDYQMAIDARRDWLWKCGDAASTEQPDELVYDAAFRGLSEVQQQSPTST